MAEPFKMKNPPIFEVVCGFIFNPIDLSNPFLLDAFVQQKQKEGYTSARIVPIAEEASAGINIQIGRPMINALPFRIWLENQTAGYLIQIQHDRYYLNWKKNNISSKYPSFSGGKDQEGIQQTAIKEFQNFSDFIQSTTSQSIQCQRVDLAKFDHFERKISPDGLAEFSKLIPMIQPLAAIQQGGASRETNNCNINIGFNEVDGNSRLSLSLTSGFIALPPANPTPIYRLETIINTQVTDGTSLESLLIDNNVKLRNVFFEMLNHETASLMFGKEDQ